MQPTETTLGVDRPLGYQQISAATLATSTALTMPTIPAGMRVRKVVCSGNGGTIRWRDDGTAPTASIGMLMADGGALTYTGDPTAIRFILASSTPVLDISYYA